MEFMIEKMVVAADDNSTADAIAALRNQLAGGGETKVNQDGTVLNPADPMSASSLANGDGFKPVDKAVVAADDNSTADAIAALRNQLAGGGETMIRMAPFLILQILCLHLLLQMAMVLSLLIRL